MLECNVHTFRKNLGTTVYTDSYVGFIRTINCSIKILKGHNDCLDSYQALSNNFQFC